MIPSDRVTTFVHVRSAPGMDSPERGRLEIGEAAELIRSVPRWYEVRLPSGLTGFVSKSWTKVTHALVDRQTDELRIHHLNIGTGACAIVECPGANAPPMIVDCGTTGFSGGDLDGNEAAAYIRAILANHSAKPNLVLSHGDTDHYSHIPTVLDGIQAANIWIGGETSTYSSHGFPAWLKEQKQGGANIIERSNMPPNWHNEGNAIGATLSCGTANTYVMTVNTPPNHSQSPKNAHSLALMIEHHEFTHIFSGDAEGTTEAQVIANFQGNVKATVMTSSHHGARTRGSNGPSWASSTAPDVMIYSAGEKHGHPNCVVVGRFTSVAETQEHSARCAESANKAYKNYRTTRAEYMTKSVGAIIITSNGHSPLALHCTKSQECGVRIPH